MAISLRVAVSHAIVAVIFFPLRRKRWADLESALHCLKMYVLAYKLRVAACCFAKLKIGVKGVNNGCS
jgi:hypothetical protein